MDPVSNPYSPGAGATPPALAGRDAVLADFDIAVRRLALGRHANSVVLTGLRGVGKTVLLREFERIAMAHGWSARTVEAGTDAAFVEDVGMAMREALLELSASARMAERGRRALGVFRSFQVTWRLPEAGEVAAGFDPAPGRADSGLLARDLRALFSEVGALARERGAGVLLTVDEVQFLKREHLEALIVALHRMAQDRLPLLVAAAGLPSVPGRLGDARSYAERLFDFHTINSLNRADAAAAVVTPAVSEGVTWRDDALEQMLSHTHGYPYFLQEFARQAWNIAPALNEITAADVTNALGAALAALDAGFFSVRADRTTDAERDCLVTMAALGDGPYRLGDLDKWPDADPVASLVERGLCYSPRTGYVDFTVPLFAGFIRRRFVEGRTPPSPGAPRI